MEIKIDGRSFPLFTTDDFTLDEQRESKRLSGGILPANFGDAILQGDPDAWYAWVLICARRVDPSISDALVGQINFAELITGWVAELQEKAEQAKDADPLAPSSGSAPPEPPASEPSSEPEGSSPSPEATPASAGGST